MPPLLFLLRFSCSGLCVTNKIDEDTSVHWHRLVLPGEVDGVPCFNGFGLQLKPATALRNHPEVRALY